MRIYLDHNATTPLDDRVCAVMRGAFCVHGNPSSIHAEGREARDLIEGSRGQVAALVGGAADEITFTSGGTEADCLGVVGLARLGRGLGRPPRLLVSPIEHPAVLGAARALAAEGFALVWLAVDGQGRVDLDQVGRECARGAAALALALANHELGTVQDVAAAAALARAHGVLVHCDAVQAAGKLPLDVAALAVDALAISAHKIHGPKGAGALWVRRGLDLAPLFEAGHQERGRRPGTENVIAVAGMGEAARIAQEEQPAWSRHVAALSARLEQGLLALDRVRVHGSEAPRVGNTVNAGFAGALGESVVAALDLEGIAASTGAACTSGSVAPSPVLLALGMPEERAVEAVRFSLGRDSSADHVRVLLEVLPPILARARMFR